MDKSSWVFVVVFALLAGFTAGEEDRQKKFLSVFNIVNFPNDPCNGSDGKNGTCYTSSECEHKGGTNTGSCASGYGVCCVFTLYCGATTSENGTYFSSRGNEIGQCQVSVCKADSNICQIRLDFSKFEIASPSASTVTAGYLLNGEVSAASGQKFTTRSQCQDDIFSVSSPGHSTPSPICGTNNGMHMYVDASEACNVLSMQLSSTDAIWQIQILQYSCDYENLAPSGCTNYYFNKDGTDLVQTFNYNDGNGRHLANQDQRICVRQEKNMCRICWTAEAYGDFQVSSMATMGYIGTTSHCCGYGSDGAKQEGPDCVIIPSATKQTTEGVFVPSEICGTGAGLVTADAMGTAGSKTVCSKKLPFEIQFITDNFEWLDTVETADQAGFQLRYTQSSC